MSYYQQPGGYAPPPSHSPQPGYYPPANQPPPPSHSPYPMYSQQQPSYPPQQQQWGQPPPGPGQYGQQPPYYQHPQQQWGQQPPPGQWGQQHPQQQQWGHSPAPLVQQQGGWGAPPPGGQYQPPPPHQGQHGAQVRDHKSTFGRLKSGVQALTAELKQPYGAGQYGKPTAHRGEDPNSDANRIHNAIKGAGTNNRELVLTLCAVQNPDRMAYLRQTYDRMFVPEHTSGGGRKGFLKAIESDVSGDYGELCTTLARTQAESDAYFVHKAINRPGTSEDLLNDVLLGRTNKDIYEMKQTYRQLYGKDMIAAVSGDLSAKTKDLFVMVLDDRRPRPEEGARCIAEEIDSDAQMLKRAMGAAFGKNTAAVLDIFTKRSDGQIRAINRRYNELFGNGTLEHDIKKKFSGHMKDALLLMLWRAVDPFKADADQLEHAMKGMGTNESLLTNRVVSVHWKKDQKDHLRQVRLVYRQSHNDKSLLDRVRGETSGWYRDFLLELLYPGLLEDPSVEQRFKKEGE